MLEKIKNIFKSSKAKIGFLFLIFLGLVVPKSVSAVVIIIPILAIKIGAALVGGGVLGAGVLSYFAAPEVAEMLSDATANALINFFFGIILTISGAFLALAQGFLNFVISPEFIKFSFTGADNVIVQMGWTMVRDFTNMFIVLGFVIIALATILRIREYHAQKLLPLLIGIALLINFTPVICGFIIDVSNITMDHFLRGAGIQENMWSHLADKIKNLIDDPKEIFKGDPLNTFAMGVVLSGFTITAAILYIMFAFLFLFRYIALWILIILSPLAFFCYILPATKSVWNLWWKQFFQWCIIGIPAAFFLWLSKNLILGMDKGNKISGIDDIGVVAIIFQYSIVLAFLLIGFLVSLQTGAMGASVVTKATKGAVQGTAKWAGGKAKETGKFLGKEGMNKVLSSETGEKIREKAENWAMAKTPGAGEKGLWAGAKRIGLELPWAAKRKIGKTISPLPEAERKIADEAAEKAKSKDYVGNTSALNSTIDSDKKVGILSTMIDKGQLGDALKSGQITKNQILDIHRHTIKMKDKDKYEKFERAYIKDGGNEMEKIAFEEGIVTEIDLAKKGHKNYQEKIIAGAKKPDELKQLQKGWHENPELLESFERTADGGKLGKMCDVGGKDFVDTHQKFVDANGPKWYLKPENYNISMINYHNSPAAVSVGLSTMTGGNKIKDDNDVSKYSEGEQQSLKQIQDMRKGNIDEATNKAKKAVGEILKDEKGEEITEKNEKLVKLDELLKHNIKARESLKDLIKTDKGDVAFETNLAQIKSRERQILKETKKIKGIEETGKVEF